MDPLPFWLHRRAYCVLCHALASELGSPACVSGLVVCGQAQRIRRLSGSTPLLLCRVTRSTAIYYSSCTTTWGMGIAVVT